MVNSLDKSMSQNGLSSLTGFAAREGAAGDLAWSWELRSVNARGLDLRLRLPEAAQSLDQPVRGRLSAALSRGAVNVTLKLRSTGGARLPQPSDAALAEAAALVIGDAAHATLPFLAQGANMALEDAWLLADCLEAGASAREAFDEFQRARAPRVTRIVGAASANARRYHLSGIKRHVGYAGLRLISAAAPGFLTRRYDWLYNADVTRGAAV